MPKFYHKKSRRDFEMHLMHSLRGPGGSESTVKKYGKIMDKDKSR